MRHGVVLVASLLLAVGSCYCDDVVSSLNEIEASGDLTGDLDAPEIDDTVLEALEELDQAQDMNLSLKQKLWLGPTDLSGEIQEKCKNAHVQSKTHLSDHKKEYLIGASAFAAGVLATVICYKLCAKPAPAA